ncbi:MAG: hypothetical protein ACHQ0I_02230 [Candidatus Lutacidiplasmatales archaeon]|nr:hypothetical protein [Thermoplasmata archaeon]
MGEGNGDWLRVRGIGRERFATYLAEYLGTLGYTVERTEVTEPMESRVKGRLERMNPALPPAASALEFRLYPTSGGAALVWELPLEVPVEQRPRMDRFVREISSHLERAIATESHATAKVVRPTESRLPWVGAPKNGGA